MNRTKAEENISLDDFKNSIKGIYSATVNKKTLDEAPFAHKPYQEILDNIRDTVEVVKRLIQYTILWLLNELN